MSEILFQLPDEPGLNLQTRIREMLVTAILDGHLPAGSPVPSGRKLSQQLNVARNTVVLAYEHLVDEGYLVAKERSGFYVNGDIVQGRAKLNHASENFHSGHLDWSNRIQKPCSKQRHIVKPDDWQKYTYPFLYGQFDPALFPIADWRDCCRHAGSVAAIHSWAGDRIDQDDPSLIHQIHTKVLPRRGVFAQPDEILITLGAQHALYLAAQLLINSTTRVGIEEPGYTDARNVFLRHTDDVCALSIDGSGLTISDQLAQCEYVYVTPSHQFPTTVTMPLQRRRELLQLAQRNDIVIIEDDYESELNFGNQPSPALKSMDGGDRVIYIGSLSKTLAPGLRMGYLVGPKEFIHEARVLRRLMLRHPPANNQHIVSEFLKRGYHDALVRRLHHSLSDRWRIMNNALEQYFPGCVEAPSFGGSAFWVQSTGINDIRNFAELARQHDVLIEPGDVFFANPDLAKGCFRLGYSSIASDRIPKGLEILAQLAKN
ncbi:MAG: GntR family transcriptional regulator/MocR family aminotransferase [Parasphingorhabdus sp.]|jgi:GntR family transcriptional regulator/MocR family aminotransferase